ncbi:hypothetical protein AB0D38_04910 [Streptomyces sp. NPDC048279]|uniref:hypothetical protein n=1 Tax=Streptomyces sp. NPDC048279 TaxID=3154714 RepID=UPI003420AD18
MDPRHVERQHDAVLDRVLGQGAHEWFVGGRTPVLKRAFVDNVRHARLDDRTRELHLPLLVLHSPVDATVDIVNAGEIFRRARHPKSFVALDVPQGAAAAPGDRGGSDADAGGTADPVVPSACR